MGLNAVRVLHLFHRYLPETQNWDFSILVELPDTDVVVGAASFLRNNFYDDHFEYIEFPLKEMDLRIRGRGVQTFNRFVRNVQHWLYAWYLARYSGHVDLVHSHFGHVGWQYLKLPLRLGAPHVVSFYGGDYEMLPRVQPIWRKRYKHLFAVGDLFLCEGTHGTRLLAKQGCPPEKIRVSRLGVRSAQINPVKRQKNRQELRLVQVAAMTEKKGHRYALEAFLRTLRDCPNMTLTFVGKDKAGEAGGIESHLREGVKRAGAEHRIRFVPRIAFCRLHEYLSDFHVFIHPSIYAANHDSEGGAPIVLLDAQATGMPVIATTHCDIPDEVVDGETGLLAPERDIDTLAAHIRRFYEMDQAEYDGFSAAARRHVETNYDIRQNAAGLRRIYEEVLSRR